jgi:hypothetical protein
LNPGSVIKTLFFGNYFYGLCTAMLSIEAALQQRFPLNDIYYYISVFLFTILYYTKAYLSGGSVNSANPRTAWYAQHRRWIKYSVWIFLVLGLLSGIYFLFQFGGTLLHVSFTEATLLCIFPITGILYYGMDNNAFPGHNLRSIGWLKPFLIGFVWAGLVTIYPLLYWCITHKRHFEPVQINYLLFLKNFMFVSVIGIMFDIKDYATDSNQRLKTFVVRNGLRKTIFYLLIPLSVLGLGAFIGYGLNNHFSVGKILLNCIPFICMILVAASLSRRKSILFYLVVIDGLMLVKAVCGIVAMNYF